MKVSSVEVQSDLIQDDSIEQFERADQIGSFNVLQIEQLCYVEINQRELF